MQPGDRLICALVKPQESGYRFKYWPLHVTIVPWFRVDMPSDELASELRRDLIGARPFKVSVGAETKAGYKKVKLMNLVHSLELNRLEGQTRRFLHAQRAWVVDEADRTRRAYMPHVTVLKTGRVHEGDSFKCDGLYLISQQGEYKRVDGRIEL